MLNQLPLSPAANKIRFSGDATRNFKYLGNSNWKIHSLFSHLGNKHFLYKGSCPHHNQISSFYHNLNCAILWYSVLFELERFRESFFFQQKRKLFQVDGSCHTYQNIARAFYHFYMFLLNADSFKLNRHPSSLPIHILCNCVHSCSSACYWEVIQYFKSICFCLQNHHNY